MQTEHNLLFTATYIRQVCIQTSGERTSASANTSASAFTLLQTHVSMRSVFIGNYQASKLVFLMCAPSLYRTISTGREGKIICSVPSFYVSLIII